MPSTLTSSPPYPNPYKHRIVVIVKVCPNSSKGVEKSSGKKVYICLGLGGDTKWPETVHLIAANDTYPQLSQSRLNETLI